MAGVLSRYDCHQSCLSQGWELFSFFPNNQLRTGSDSAIWVPHPHHGSPADESEGMEVHSTWLDWTMSLSQLFDHNDAEQITSMVHKIRDTMTGSFDASERLQQLDQLDKPFQSIHRTFSSPPAMIGIFLLIALLSFTRWKKCCTKIVI
jgi:hypothetical protein